MTVTRFCLAMCFDMRYGLLMLDIPIFQNVNLDIEDRNREISELKQNVSKAERASHGASELFVSSTEIQVRGINTAGCQR